MRKMVVVIAAGALALAACGGDDDDDASDGGGDVSAEEQPYVDAIAASFTSDDPGELTMTEEQANCVAPRWIDSLGVDSLKDAGIEPEDVGADSDMELTDLDLSEEQGGDLYDAFGACDVDVKELFIGSIAEDAEMSDEDRECLADNFDDDLLRRLMVTTLTEGEEALDADEELMSELFSVFAECPGAAG